MESTVVLVFDVVLGEADPRDEEDRVCTGLGGLERHGQTLAAGDFIGYRVTFSELVLGAYRGPGRHVGWLAGTAPASRHGTARQRSGFLAAHMLRQVR
jgi:hypothetical protein